MSVKTKMTAIADAIRNATGITSEMTIDQMISNVPFIEGATTSGLIDRSVTNYVIPASVTSIGDYAFQQCISLTSVTLPSGVTSIGVCAFYECTSLTAVTLPSGVTSIGKYAFRHCTNLTDIYCGFSEGAVSGAPWGAPDTTAIHYNSQGE